MVSRCKFGLEPAPPMEGQPEVFDASMVLIRVVSQKSTGDKTVLDIRETVGRGR